MTLLLYRPRDLTLLSPPERSSYFSRLESALRLFGTDWHLLFDAHTAPTASYTTSEWSNPTSAFLDALHALPFTEKTYQETSYYLTIAYKPSTSRASRWMDIFSSPPKSSSPSPFAEEVSLFLSRVQTFSEVLSSIFPISKLASPTQLCTYLHSTVSNSSHTILHPHLPLHLSSQLTDTPLIHAYTPALGSFLPDGSFDGQFLSLLSLKSWPDSLGSFIPQTLQSLPFPSRLSVKWSPLDYSDADTLITTTQNQWSSALTSIWQMASKTKTPEGEVTNANNTRANTLSSAQQKHIDSMKSARILLESHACSFGYVTPTILLTAPSTALLTIRTRETVALLQSQGCVLSPEDVGATSTYLSTLPGSLSHSPRTIPAPSSASVFLAPNTAIWAGPLRDAYYKSSPLFTASSQGTPLRVALHPGDSEIGSLAIFGPPGTGKSALIGFVCSQFDRYPHKKIFLFDKDYQNYGTTLFHGGSHVGFTDKDNGFCPLSLVGKTLEETSWCLDWLTHLFTAQSLPPTPSEREEIFLALKRLGGFPPALRTLTGFSKLLQARRLLPALRPFLLGGPYAFFDASQDSFSLSSFTTFEMRHILALPHAFPHAMRLLFHRIRASFDGSPILIIIDEIRKPLEDPLFASEVIDYLAEGRKHNVSSILATQEIAQLYTSPIWQVVKNTIKTWLFLPNDKALDPSVLPFYEDCGLTSTICDILAHSTPKRDYLYHSDEGTRMFQLTLSRLERLLCAASTKEEIREIAQLYQSSLTEPLVAAWLRLKGFSVEADIFNVHYYQEKDTPHDFSETDNLPVNPSGDDSADYGLDSDLLPRELHAISSIAPSSHARNGAVHS